MKTFAEFYSEKIKCSMEHANKWIDEYFPEALKRGIHEGDCTDLPCTCDLCLLEMMLGYYYKYMKENQVKEKQ